MTVVFNIVAYSLWALGIIVYVSGFCKSCQENGREFVINKSKEKSCFCRIVNKIGVWSYIWTVLSGIICVGAVFFSYNDHKVLWYSKFITAPIFFFAVIAAICVKIIKKEHADSLLFDGISILALTAAIFQLY